MKTVGVIGGLGPETTAHFYTEVVFACNGKNGGTRPPMLLWNVPIPIQMEEEFIKNTTGRDTYIPLLIDAAQRLERGGADFIVIPCNSVHLFINEVRNAVKIPVLSIVEETVSFLKANSVQEVGILATSVTLREKLYDSLFSQNGIDSIVPTEDQQSQMGDIINRLVQRQQDNSDKQELLNIIDSFISQGINTIVLACTDLQLLIPSHDSVKIYDTMKILADATVREILK